MCRGNADMRWQFGGNFQPVRMICEENWKECPFAVLNYVWSEVVTEVVDCLSNDVLIWRIIAMMVVFMMLVHTVYYKLRWIDETSVNRENLNRVGFKVQDLELKVNILTYKLQYGTWPLPHHMRKSEVGNELHNVRLTLSNSEERNSWIKHLLLSPRKNKDYNLSNKNLAHSAKSMTKLINLETKYISSKFQNDVSPIESGDKTVRCSSDNSTRKWKRCKKCFDITLSKQRQISKSENLGLRRRQSPKSISLLKKEKNDSQVINSNLNSNETFVLGKESKVTEKIERRAQNPVRNEAQSQEQNQELCESYSESTNTCSDRNIYEENQLERDSSHLSEESDINHNTKMGVEGRLEKAEDPEMERLTRTENNLEIQVDDNNSTNEIQPSAKSTNDTFYSWTDYDTVENTPRNETPNNLPPNLNITFLTETFPKPTEFRTLNKPIESVFGALSNRHSLTTTQETLHQVREKLESLHNILIAFESKDGNQNECNSMIRDCIMYKDAKSKKSSKVSFNMDIKENLITTEEEILNSSEYEQCESIIQSSSTSLSVQSYSNMFSVHKEMVVNNSNHSRVYTSDSGNEDEKSQTGLENSSNVSINTFTKFQFESRENLSELKSDFASKSYNINFNIDRITTSHNQNYIIDHKSMENCVPMDTSEDQISRCSSQTEFSNDETSDNQSTSALLQEALQFKDALVSQLEWEKELKINQKNIIKEKEDELDLRKNSWPKVDNYFQIKILDIITEEQSASSSTEKTSKTFVMPKMSEEQDLPQHQRVEENLKSVFASTSSEYFSVSNLSQSDKVLKESEAGSDKEHQKEFQSELPSPSNKRVMNSEISPIDLVKRSKYMTQREKEERSSEEKGSESESENVVSSKQTKNFKEEKIRQEKLKEEKPKDKVKETTKEENNKEQSLKDYQQDSEIQRVEEQNTNTFSPIMDSSSDESLTQFIKELANDKVKAARIFRESKLNLNFAKSEEQSSNVNEAQEQESTLTLQRRPGSFSLTESTNSDVEVTTKYGNIDTDSQTREKEEECKFKEMKDTINKNVNERVKSCENIDTGPNFDLDDSELSLRSVRTTNNKPTGGSFREESIKEVKSEESIIKVSEARSEYVKLEESTEQNKSEFSLNEETSECLDSQEKIDKLQSNLTSDASSSLYFTAEASNSDIKLDDKYLTSSTSISKVNLEVQETILEDANECLTPENKICENRFEKLNEEPKANEEMMLIDLSDNDISGQKSEIEKPETPPVIYSENKNSEIENLNILDAAFGETIKENVCLVPKKIQPMNESENTFNNSSETRSCDETKRQNLLNVSGISLFEKPTVNSANSRMKISEINKFSHCTSAPSLQRSLCNSRKSSTSMRTKQKVETPIKSRTLTKHSTEKSAENSKENCDKNDRNISRENSSKERQSRTNSYWNLNLGKQSSGDQIQKRSRSFVAPRIMKISPRSSNNLHCEEGIKSARDSIRNPMEMDQQISLTSRTSIKSFESQKSSRSCIPLLKTRLENIRKPEHRSRPRSPMRGPLTISPRPDARDLKVAKDLDVRREAKGERNDCNEKSFGDNTDTVINLLKEQSQGPNENTVIYVNIMTDQDKSKKKIVDPKKFLKFVKDSELKIHNIINKEKSETDSEPKILAAVSSLTEKDNLSRRSLQSKFSFQVEHKEREISVKPSVMDNSTSVSDFPEFCDDGKQNKSKFKIFQVPEELTKEEYIDLLDSLNQDPNLEQLKKMHKLCSKLGLGFQE